MLALITNGSLLWKMWVPSQKSEDKESLINGTRGVEILLCDGKHMAFFNRASEALAEFRHAHCQHSLLLDPASWKAQPGLSFPLSSGSGSSVRHPYRVTRINPACLPRNQ